MKIFVLHFNLLLIEFETMEKIQTYILETHLGLKTHGFSERGN